MARRWLPNLSVLLLGVLVGCGGKYTMTFESAEVINAAGDDNTRKQLDVDILCLTNADIKNHPELADGTVRSDEWFKAKTEDSAKYANIAAAKINSLRHGGSTARDTLKGGPLASARDGKKSLPVEVKHDSPGSGALVIFGKFDDKSGGVARTPPVIVKPAPGWNKSKDLTVRVDRTSMSLAGGG